MKTLFSCSLLLLLSMTLQADPTRPAIAMASAKPPASAVAELRVELIRQTEQVLSAMINGTLLRQGDRFEHYQVVRIAPKQVTLQSAEGQHILYLHSRTIKNYDN